VPELPVTFSQQPEVMESTALPLLRQIRAETKIISTQVFEWVTSTAAADG
jgi:hypothetical protein